MLVKMQFQMQCGEDIYTQFYDGSGLGIPQSAVWTAWFVGVLAGAGDGLRAGGSSGHMFV
jgi:hypothetical protein